jgi:response regulator of citrate/malate metabolism
MDLTMQGLGGLEVTSKIIAADPKAKIIVISAMEARQAIIEALERGARHFIIKPIKKEKVSLVISNILRQDFAIDEHMERVRKLKEMDLSISSGAMAKAILPPYRISLEDSRLVHVMISESITETSLETLSEEIEEYLGDSIRILLDFGAMSFLAETLVKEFGNLIQKLENGNGIVRAITSSEHFVKSVTELKTEEFNYLANIVRVY